MKYCQKEIRIAMIDADVTQTELAENAGYTIHYTNKLLNTEKISPITKKHLLQTIARLKEEKA